MAMVYGYGRHSTGKQSLSEEAQRHKVEHHISVMLPEHTYAGWLYDGATSGKTSLFEREQGRNLWLLAQPGDHIVWAKLDRAFRSVADGATTLEMLRAKGVFVHSLDLGLDTSTPTGRFISTVMLAFAELERECIGDRTREGLAAKKRSGKPYTHHTPIGWRKVGKKRYGQWLPCEREREQVRRIVHMREHGISLKGVVHTLRDTPRPNGYYWNRNSVCRAVKAFRAGFPKHFLPEREPEKADA